VSLRAGRGSDREKKGVAITPAEGAMSGGGELLHLQKERGCEEEKLHP